MYILRFNFSKQSETNILKGPLIHLQLNVSITVITVILGNWNYKHYSRNRTKHLHTQKTTLSVYDNTVIKFIDNPAYVLIIPDRQKKKLAYRMLPPLAFTFD